MPAPVLIVGAGPTGLNLALWLHRLRVPVRLVDRTLDPAPQSRALIVHARTLEFYRQLGIADRALDRGTPIGTMRLREAGAEIAHVDLAAMGAGLSPYPTVLCLPQDEHEALLVEVLAAEGVEVERGVALAALDQRADGVTATLVRDGRREVAAFAWVAGCDGAHSSVRHALGVPFGGGTYDRLFYVADVRPAAPLDPDFVVALDREALALRLPARRGENQRLIGFVPRAAEAAPDFAAVRADAERLLGMEVAAVHWFSTYRVHHRVAGDFRRGRVFLLGDAAHVHSPVGGQGMNTGIGDAANLAWKLAAVVHGDAAPALLDSYAPERRGFARTLVATTDRAFRLVAGDGWTGRAVRRWVMPHLVPAIAARAAGKRMMFRTLSQTRIAYPDSPLSGDGAGAVAAGERLPWVADRDNFAALASLRWQVHVYGTPGPDLGEAAAALGLETHAFAWSDDAARAGLARDAAYLVRPDGHVATACARGQEAALGDYAKGHKLRWRRGGAAS